MLAHPFGDMVIGHGGEAGDRLICRVHDDGHHLPLTVLIGHLVDRDGASLPFEVSCHLLNPRTLGLHGQFVGEVNVNVDRFDFHKILTSFA